MTELISKKDAIELLKIEDKEFENYFRSSGELKGQKIGTRWYFDKQQLMDWKNLKESRTVILSLEEYEKCFEFAIKMAYGNNNSHGTGIRGVRSEVQKADDFILGILAEMGVQKLLKDKFNITIKLDTEAHPDHITPQDFDGIIENGMTRNTKITVAVKSSKMKSCYNIIPPIEYENPNRKSDIYIFVRVGIPSDHLFRILRNHSFFKKVCEFLENNNNYKKIKELREIPVWVCGYSYHNELEKVTEIPGQQFNKENPFRYVKSVANMHNTDKDWKELISKL